MTDQATKIGVCDVETGAELSAQECVLKLAMITEKQQAIDEAQGLLATARVDVSDAKEVEAERLGVVNGLKQELADLVKGQKLMF